MNRRVKQRPKAALDFLAIPQGKPKPRTSRWTVPSDKTIPLRYQEDLLGIYGDVIDRVKLSDHVGLMGRFPPALVRKKNAIYRKRGIRTFPGGVPFEIAYLQNQVERYFNALPGLGFSGVEISADTIPPIPRKRRTELIRMGRAAGLEVFTEVGEKLSGAAIKSRDAVTSICGDLEAGATKVVIENNDLCHFLGSSPQTIAEIARAVGLDRLIFELGPGGWPDLAVWLLRELGSDINVENIDIASDRLMAFEAMRRGLSRLIDYEHLTAMAKR